MPGTSRKTHRPRVKFAFVDFQFSNNNHKRPENFHRWSFQPSCVTFLFQISPEHCGLVIDVDIPTSAAQSEITHRYDPITVQNHWQCLLWSTPPCFFTASFYCFLGSERMQCCSLRFLVLHHYFHCQTYHPSIHVWLQIESRSISAPKSGCNIPVLLCSVSSNNPRD